MRKMKKQYQIPSADILKMCPLSPLAVEQSIDGDWGPEGGEAGAKGTSLDIDDDDDEFQEERSFSSWDSSDKPLTLKEAISKMKFDK